MKTIIHHGHYLTVEMIRSNFDYQSEERKEMIFHCLIPYYFNLKFDHSSENYSYLEIIFPL
jgi:hypothetical protein